MDEVSATEVVLEAASMEAHRVLTVSEVLSGLLAVVALIATFVVLCRKREQQWGYLLVFLVYICAMNTISYLDYWGIVETERVGYWPMAAVFWLGVVAWGSLAAFAIHYAVDDSKQCEE